MNKSQAGKKVYAFHAVFRVDVNDVKPFQNPTETSPFDHFLDPQSHTGQCKRTGGCYNELVVAFYSTGGGVKGKKIYTC